MKHYNLKLLSAVIVLSVFGVIMVYSASKYNAEYYYNDPFFYAAKQFLGLFLGIISMFFLSNVHYEGYRKIANWLYLISVLLLLLVFVPIIGIERLGAKRWVGFGGFSIQPSEIAKFAFVIFAAKTIGGDFPTIKQSIIVLLSGGLLCGLIIAEPNMSITMTVGIIMFVMLFLCGSRLKFMFWLLVPALALVVVMLVAEPYRLERLSAFIDPWANPKDEGFQLIQSLYAIGNGGLFGVGFGNSTQKYMFLPFSESDFIFSIIAEEFGLVGCLILFATFAFIIWQIFLVGRKCSNRFGRYLCYGIAVVISVQTALNFAVATGSIPPTGLPLPFISFGGTSLLVFMSAIGIVLNIDKQNKKMV